MSIVKMKRLRVIALNEQKDDLLSALIHVGCVEVTEPEGKLSDPEWTAIVRRDTTSITDVKAKAGALSSALEALKKYGGVKAGMFMVRPNVTEQELLSEERLTRAEIIAEKINDEVREISANYAKENRLRAQGANLIPWKILDWPLEKESTECADLSFGSLPAAVDTEKLADTLEAAVPEAEFSVVHEDKEQKYILLITHKAVTEDALNVMRESSFSAVHFKDVHGTAQENLARLDTAYAELAADRQARAKKIASFKGEAENIELCLDRLNQEAAKQQTREKFLAGETVFFMEGWLSALGEEKLRQTLDGFCCAYEITEPEKEEKPPILLKNPWWMKPMNMVVEMYSLPDYYGLDPVPLIWPFYVLYFGLMFADVGYGLLMLAVGLILWKKFKPKKTMGYICGLAILLGASTAICGIFTGGYFGDFISVFTETYLGHKVTMWSLIDPLKNPMTVLILSIVLGIVQMFFGMCLKLYMGWRDGDLKEALLDVIPWWLFLGGVAVIAFTGNAVLIWIGVVALVATQGRHNKSIIGKIFGGITSLYDVTSWLGDILSYSRIMALMLATTVIASVVNLMATLPGNIIAFFLIVVIGHIFNLAINIIGTYVHAARLQYLEFFGKFYKDGGVAFKPLAYDTQYVDIEEQEEESKATA